MFIENITWFNASVEREARTRCGDDIECLFDAAATNDVSIGLVTKDINTQFENETNILGKHNELDGLSNQKNPSVSS